ncbi:DUF167 domain-containing protein [archaeon]
MIKQTPEGVVIEVRVIPGSKDFSIAGEDEWTGDIKIKVKSKALEGKANQELVNELGKRLSAEVKIISGHKSRRKALLAVTSIDSVNKLVK